MVESCYRYPTIEEKFKHLFGRAPNDNNEAESGEKAEIDFDVDSHEYQHNFGENIIPYHCWAEKCGLKLQVPTVMGIFQ